MASKYEFKVISLRQWLKVQVNNTAAWTVIVIAFFERYQTLPGFGAKEDWMMDGVPAPDSREAPEYVRKIFSGFLDGLARVHWGNESENVSDLVASICNSLYEEDEDGPPEVIAWDTEQACLMIGAILVALGQLHDHTSTGANAELCVRARRSLLFQLVSACHVMLHLIEE